jgi:hypothetical protein
LSFQPLSDAQAKQVIDAEQAYAAWQDAWVSNRTWSGGMHWKTVAGREYLYRTQDGTGKAKSLGVRSPETEQIAAQFHSGKAAAQVRLKNLKATLVLQAKINAVLRLGSAPVVVAEVCLRLSRAGLMGKNLMVIGTNSMLAYEAMAGVRFAREVMATTDIDLLWSHKAHLALTTWEDETDAVPQDLRPQSLAENLSDNPAVGPTSLMAILQKADKSFQRMAHQHFRAANDQGFLVDLIRQMPAPPWKNEPESIGAVDDLVATDIWNMNWLLNAPRVNALAIAVNGTVFPISAPDPRAYCAFKLWLAQADERNPQKKSRDLAQAKAVYALIKDRLPHLHKNWAEITSIPKAVMEQVISGELED